MGWRNGFGAALVALWLSFAANAATDEAVLKRLQEPPQLYYSWGPFGLLGEYVRSDNPVRRGAVDGDVDVESWQLAASYVLTGENASFNGVTPREPFNPSGGGLGAFEIAARYGELEIDDDAFDLGFANSDVSARHAREATGGLNWYLNRWLKLQTNYSRTWFDGGAPNGHDRDTEHFVATRLQFSY